MNFPPSRLLLLSSTVFLWLCCCCLESAAFPTGAGGCPGGQPAVGVPHRNASTTVTTGTLDQGNVRINVEGNSLPLEKPFYLFAKQAAQLKIIAPFSGDGIRGVLIRLGHSNLHVNEAYDLTSTLSPVPSTNPIATEDKQIRLETTYCPLENAAGLTHADNSPKYLIDGILQVDDVISDLTLDVTVVFQNRNGISEFYYSNYTLHVVAPTAPPTEAPGSSTLYIGDTSTAFTMHLTSLVIMTLGGLIHGMGLTFL